MKNKLLLLLKTNITNLFKLKKLTKKNILLYIILGIYLIGASEIVVSLLLKNIFETLLKSNLTSFYIPILFSVTSIFTIIFTIFSAKAWLFENKDNDLLLSLPIKKSTILLNRLLYLILLNLVLGLLIIIPGLIIYAINIKVNLIFYIYVIIMVLFFPIIPTIISSIFGYLVAFITSKAKNKNIVELLSYIIFIAIYFVIYNNANTIFKKLIEDPILLENILKFIFAPIYIITKAISTNNILYVLLFIVINIALIWIFITLLSRGYYKIISKLNTHQVKSNFHMHALTTKSQTKSLIEKEIKRYFSSAIYIFNTIFGVVIIVLTAIASFFYSPEKIVSLMETEVITSPFKLVFCLLLFGISFTNTTNSCISIERNNFWIIKMIPVDPKIIFKAKLFVNRIILIPLTFISLILFQISGTINFQEMLLLMIFTVIFNFFVSNIGLIINLCFPKFDAINDTVIVKQSMSSLVGLLIPFLIAITLIIFTISTTMNNTNILLITIAISIILYIITTLIINKWGIKRFSQIS